MAAELHPSDSLQDLLEDENKIVIVFLIYVYGSLNLKIIARLMGKSEPPILRWIKKMLEEKILILDQAETKRSRGKYYKLSPHTESLFSIEEFPIKIESDRENDSSTSQIRQALNLVKSLGILSDISAKALVNTISDQLNRENFTHQMKQGEIMALNSFSMVHFKNKAEIQRFRELFQEFSEKVEQEFDTEGVLEPKEFSHSMSFSILPTAFIKQKIDEMKKDW